MKILNLLHRNLQPLEKYFHLVNDWGEYVNYEIFKTFLVIFFWIEKIQRGQNCIYNLFLPAHETHNIALQFIHETDFKTIYFQRIHFCLIGIWFWFIKKGEIIFEEMYFSLNFIK